MNLAASGYRQEKVFSRVYLLRWSGSQVKVHVQSSPWLWSIVSNAGLSTVGGFVPNGNVTPSFGFGIEQAGHYRVAVKYVGHRADGIQAWAGNHRTGDTTWEACSEVTLLEVHVPVGAKQAREAA